MESRGWVSINTNNNSSSSGLEWEILGNNNNQNQQMTDFSNMSTCCCSATNGFCGHHHSVVVPGGAVSFDDEFGKLGSSGGYLQHHHYSYNSRNYVYDGVIRRSQQQDSASGEPLTGLRLGRQKEYGVGGGDKALLSSLPVCSVPTKRSRASFQNMQNPCCQVQGCNLDLKLAKDYHRRHRICEAHSKSPKVIVAGLERRFCQQCSRFHELSEFDDKKRSCRRRLSDHNARRRRVQPESIHHPPGNGMQSYSSSSSSSSAALHDERTHNNILLNGLPISLSNSGNNHLRLLDQWGMDVNVITSAQSLLSSGSAWSLKESSGMEGLIMSNNGAAMKTSSSNNNTINNVINEGEGEGEGEGVSQLHSITDTSQSYVQEFHLFYDPARFYDSHAHTQT